VGGGGLCPIVRVKAGSFGDLGVSKNSKDGEKNSVSISATRESAGTICCLS
jgi:hypothetical protein